MNRSLRPVLRSAWHSMIAAWLLAVLLPALAPAAESNVQQSPRATVSLVSDHAAASPGQTLRIGLRQRLAPHWHTYWKNPGDAGSPPNVAFTLPPGVAVGEIAWPGPDRFIIGPVASYGYENEIVFPMTLSVPRDARPGSELLIEARADWVVCEKECIPEEGRFRLRLPVEAAARPAAGAVRAAFAIADARLPQPAPWNASLSSAGATLQLRVAGEGISPQSVQSALYFPENWGIVDHVAPQALKVEQGALTLSVQQGQGYQPGAAQGLLAVTDGGGQKRWFALAPTPAAGSAGMAATAATAVTAPEAASNLPLWQMAAFAFLGGLILNLMPCVFPVLAIKATALAGISGGDRRAVRLSGVFYTLGVLAAFLALALALLAVRAGGSAVGWGFQFQSPLFVAAMCWLMLAIGLNLSGVFEIGASFAGAGQQLAQRQGHAGSFFTGLLAVVVATPCTAPFMGAAIGSALVAPAVVSLVVFAMMGLGLALPFLLLAFFPAVAGRLPRPGLWMVRLRQAMAFPMYATAAWLLWVLAQQAGETGLRMALAGSVLVGLVAWLVGLGQQGMQKAWLPRGFALAGVAGLVGLMASLHGAEPVAAASASTSAPQAGNAEPYSAERLAALRAEGKPVFVNMTAAWCITCLVNERTTLSTAAVKQSMQERSVVYMKGDWTNRDPAITAFLRSFQRDGLPFYVFYPPGKEPVVLPPVLTQAIVTDTLKQ